MFWVASLGCQSSHAQSEASAEREGGFETVRIALAPSFISRASGLEEWQTGLGARASASTPYYGGRLELEISWAPWTTNESSLPDFQALSLLAGWSISTSSEYRIGLGGGFLVGNVFMLIDIDESEDGRFESEIIVAPFVRILGKIKDNTHAFVEFRGVRFYTRPRLEYADISMGITLDLETPAWLRRFLR